MLYATHSDNHVIILDMSNCPASYMARKIYSVEYPDIKMSRNRDWGVLTQGFYSVSCLTSRGYKYLRRDMEI